MSKGFTQERAAEIIQVSRQTISNWENEKSYPDIVSVIKLSDLYHISLDKLLKGDEKMIEHLEESTNTVNSNRKLILAIALNIFLLILFLLFSRLFGRKKYPSAMPEEQKNIFRSRKKRAGVSLCFIAIGTIGLITISLFGNLSF